MRFSWVFFPLILHATPGYFEPWGKDADLQRRPIHAQAREQIADSERDKPKAPVSNSLAVAIAERVITFHQTVISPVDGPRSHFKPSSSQYMLLSMRKHGFLNGFFMGCDRLMRENSDEWVYRKIEAEGKLFKYDPVR